MPDNKTLTPAERATVRRYLTDRFGLLELKSLADETGADYENLPHNTKDEFARELLAHAIRKQTLAHLLELALNERNDSEVASLSGQLGQTKNDATSPSNQTTNQPSSRQAQPLTQINHNYYGNYNNFNKGENTVSETFNFSGNFQGAILNVKSTLNNTVQNVGAIPNAQPADQAALTDLINRLSEALQTAPQDKASEAEKVAKRADELVTEAKDEDTDKEAVEAKGNLLLKAAQNVAGALPAVLPIATAIVQHIAQMVH